MNVQDKIKIWVSNQLDIMGHGSKKKFADFLGLDPTKVTRMLNTSPHKESRVIKAEEYIKIVEFFGGLPDDIGGIDREGEKNKIISIYDSSSPEVQKMILAMVEALSSQSKK